MGYQLLTGAIVALHYGFLAYLVGGGLLAMRWPRTLLTHLLTAGWGVAVLLLGLDCPLTLAEDWSRQQAGEPPLTSGFIDRYVEGVLYPDRLTGLVQLLVAMVVLGSWIALFRRSARSSGPGIPGGRRRRTATAPSGAPPFPARSDRPGSAPAHPAPARSFPAWPDRAYPAQPDRAQPAPSGRPVPDGPAH